MPTDASIPLSYRPTTQLNNPAQEYARILSLRNMQMQQQQEAQLAPLRYQQAQLQVQAAQREADNTAKAAQIYRDVYGTPDTASAPPPAAAAPAAPAAPAPAAADTGVDEGPTSIYWNSPEGGAAGATDTAPAEVPPRSALIPASTLAAQPAAPAGTPIPSTPPAGAGTVRSAAPNRDNVFAQKMAAADLGAYVPRILQERAVSQEAQIRAQQMQQDQQDQENAGRAYNDAKGDLDQFLTLATQYGVSQRGLAAIRQNMITQQAALVKLKGEQADLGVKQITLEQKRHGELADRMNAFLQRPDDDSPEGMKANWSNFVESAYHDGLTTDAEHAQTLQQFPTFPGMAVATNLRNRLNTSTSLYNNARAMVEQTNAANAQRQQVIGKLIVAAGQGEDAFQKAAKDNNIDPSTLPAQFDAAGKPIPGAVDALRQSGLTLQQQQTAKNAANTLAATTNYRNARLAQEDKRIARETPSEHKQTISQLADQAIADSVSNGGSGIDSALANVNNPKFYQGNPIGDNRGEVAKELQARQSAGLTVQNKQATLDKNGSRLSGLDTMRQMRDQKRQGKTGAPAAPAATPPPAPTPQAAPAAPKPQAPAAPKQAATKAEDVIAALQKARIKIDARDSADGMPIFTKGNQQYKITGIDPDGTVHTIPGKWSLQ